MEMKWLYTLLLIVECIVASSEEKSDTYSIGSSSSSYKINAHEDKDIKGLDHQHMLFKDYKGCMCEREDADTFVINMETIIGAFFLQMETDKDTSNDESKNKIVLEKIFSETLPRYKRLCIVGMKEYNIIENSISQSDFIDMAIREAQLCGITRIELRQMILDRLPKTLCVARGTLSDLEELSLVEVYYVEPFVQMYRNIYYNGKTRFDSDSYKDKDTEWRRGFDMSEGREEREEELTQLISLCIFMNAREISSYHNIDVLQQPNKIENNFVKNIVQTKKESIYNIIRQYERVISYYVDEDTKKDTKCSKRVVDINTAKFIATIVSQARYYDSMYFLYNILHTNNRIEKIRIENSIFPDFPERQFVVEENNGKESVKSTKTEKNTLIYNDYKDGKAIKAYNLKHLTIVSSNLAYFDILFYTNRNSLFSFNFCYAIDSKKEIEKREDKHAESSKANPLTHSTRTCASLEDLEILEKKLDSSIYRKILDAIPCIGVDMLIKGNQIMEEIKQRNILQQIFKKKKYLLVNLQTLKYLITKKIVHIQDLLRIYITDSRGNVLMSYYIENEYTEAIRVYIYRFTMSLEELHCFLDLVTNSFADTSMLALIVEAPPNDICSFLKSLYSPKKIYSTANLDKSISKRNIENISLKKWNQLINRKNRVPVKKYFIFSENYFVYHKVDFLWSIPIYNIIMQMNLFTSVRCICVPDSIYECPACCKTVDAWLTPISFLRKKTVFTLPDTQRTPKTEYAAAQKNAKAYNKFSSIVNKKILTPLKTINISKKSKNSSRRSSIESISSEIDSIKSSILLPTGGEFNEKTVADLVEYKNYTKNKKKETLNINKMFKLLPKDQIIKYLGYVVGNIEKHSTEKEMLDKLCDYVINYKYSKYNYSLCPIENELESRSWQLDQKTVRKRILEIYTKILIKRKKLLDFIESHNSKERNKDEEIQSAIKSAKKDQNIFMKEQCNNKYYLVLYWIDCVVKENINSSFLSKKDIKNSFFHRYEKSPYTEISKYSMNKRKESRTIEIKRKHQHHMFSEFRKEYLFMPAGLRMTAEEINAFVEAIFVVSEKDKQKEDISKLTSLKEIYEKTQENREKTGKRKDSSLIANSEDDLCSKLYSIESSLKPVYYHKGYRTRHTDIICSKIILETFLTTDILVSFPRISERNVFHIQNSSVSDEKASKHKEIMKEHLQSLKQFLYDLSKEEERIMEKILESEHIANLFSVVDRFYSAELQKKEDKSGSAQNENMSTIKERIEKRKDLMHLNITSVPFVLSVQKKNIVSVLTASQIFIDCTKKMHAFTFIPTSCCAKWPLSAFALSENRYIPFFMQKNKDKDKEKNTEYYLEMNEKEAKIILVDEEDTYTCSLISINES